MLFRSEALKYLQAHADFQSAEDQATISDALTDRSKEPKVKAVKVKVSKPSLDAIKARGKKSEQATQEVVAE